MRLTDHEEIRRMDGKERARAVRRGQMNTDPAAVLKERD